jgi:hypothetical protein
MPVIINEFEVVSEAPAPEGGGEAAQAAGPASLAPTPHDVEKILAHLAERLARLFAD